MKFPFKMVPFSGDMFISGWGHPDGHLGGSYQNEIHQAGWSGWKVVRMVRAIWYPWQANEKMTLWARSKPMMWTQKKKTHRNRTISVNICEFHDVPGGCFFSWSWLKIPSRLQSFLKISIPTPWSWTTQVTDGGRTSPTRQKSPPKKSRGQKSHLSDLCRFRANLFFFRNVQKGNLPSFLLFLGGMFFQGWLAHKDPSRFQLHVVDEKSKFIDLRQKNTRENGTLFLWEGKPSVFSNKTTLEPHDLHGGWGKTNHTFEIN